MNEASLSQSEPVLFFLALIALLGRQDGTRDGTNHEKTCWVLEPVRDSRRCLSLVGGQSQHGVSSGSNSHPLCWEVLSPAPGLLVTVPDSKYSTCHKRSPSNSGRTSSVGGLFIIKVLSADSRYLLL